MDSRFLPREELTPLPSDFAKTLEKAKALSKKPVVLLNTGSYCPVHLSHVEFLLKIKKFLEGNFHFMVIAIYISPSNNAYVHYKSENYGFQQHFLSFEERCQLVEFTIAESNKNSNNIILDKWEGSHEEFIDFPTVWVQTQLFFDRKCREYGFEEGFVSVMYCVGSDMLKTGIDIAHRKMSCDGKNYDLPLAICGRKSGNGDKADRKMAIYQSYSNEEMLKEKLFFIKSDDEGVSSTIIRKLIEDKNDKKLYQIMEKNAADFVLENLPRRKNPKVQTENDENPVSKKKTYADLKGTQ